MLPLFVRIAVPPPFALRKMPAAGRPDIELMLPRGVTEAGGVPGRRGVPGGVKGVACQPPMIDPPGRMFTVAPPLPPCALIAVPNSPGVDTLLAVTCTGRVTGAMGSPLITLRIVPLSARIPTASEPSAVIRPVAPEASTVTLPLGEPALALPETATMPRPPAP